MTRIGLAVLVVLRLAMADAGSAVVVPHAQATVEGNSDNVIPFSCAAITTSQRYQQVYLGSEVGTGTITQIAFRPDVIFGTAFGPTTIKGVTITLSSTTAAPDSMSLTFASNVGVDVTTVFSGNLVLHSANTGGPPRNFDIIIPLSTPFSFNASNGMNLLLDVTVPTCATTTSFDAQYTLFDPVSRTSTLVANSSESPTADLADTTGLVTQFTVTPPFTETPTATPAVTPTATPHNLEDGDPCNDDRQCASGICDGGVCGLQHRAPAVSNSTTVFIGAALLLAGLWSVRRATQRR